MDRMRIIDAHQSFYLERPYRADPRDPPAAGRCYTPDDLRPLLVEAGVDATLLVQTWASLAETWAFLELAAQTDFIAGVVGWVDLTYPLVADTLASLHSSPNGRYLVGVRHRVDQETDSTWLLRTDVQHGLAAVQDAGLTFDLAVGPRELPAALETVCQWPHLRFVIDHCARPPIAAGALTDWVQRLALFGEQGNVWCKLSGLVTEADSDWQAADLVPVVAQVLAIFGEDRVVFGSDWPVCLRAAGYAEVKEALEEALGDRHVTAWAKIFGGNAQAAYRLQSGVA